MAVTPRVVNITRRRVITDNTPNQFTFDDISNADLSTNYESNAITVSGLIGSAAISVVGGTYSLNGGAQTSASGFVVDGDVVIAGGTSPETNSAQTDVTVIIGTVSDTFSIMTVQEDITPDTFSFTPVLSASFATTYESNTITVTGITSTAPVSLNTSGLSGPVGYSKNGGAYTSAPGVAALGDTFKVRLTTGALTETPYTTTLTIGGTVGAFTVTTTEYIPALNFSIARNSQYVAAIAA